MKPFAFDATIIFVAGFLDAIGVTHLHGIFVSFMSGNSIGLGVAAAHAELNVVIPIASAIASFVTGAFVGSLIAQRCTSATSIVLLLELGSLSFAVILVRETASFTALLPVCVAMGMQNAIPRAVSGVAIGRSFVTGELFGVGRCLALAVEDRAQLKQAAIHCASWLIIVLGAICGAACLAQFGLALCVLFCAALVLLLAIFEAYERTTSHALPDRLNRAATQSLSSSLSRPIQSSRHPEK